MWASNFVHVSKCGSTVCFEFDQPDLNNVCTWRATVGKCWVERVSGPPGSRCLHSQAQQVALPGPCALLNGRQAPLGRLRVSALPHLRHSVETRPPIAINAEWNTSVWNLLHTSTSAVHCCNLHIYSFFPYMSVFSDWVFLRIVKGSEAFCLFCTGNKRGKTSHRKKSFHY